MIAKTILTRPAIALVFSKPVKSVARWLRLARDRLFGRKISESEFLRAAGGRAYRLGRLKELFETADRRELELLAIRREIAALSRELGFWDVRDAIKAASVFEVELKK
jgi:hypothetical protein